MYVQLLGKRQRALPMALVFVLSAVFHEYILTMTFGFFYPVLFIMFAGAGCKNTSLFIR